MSAFFVSKAHIDVLVSAVPGWNLSTRYRLPASDLAELGKLLWSENLKSVSHLYRLRQERVEEFAGYQTAIDAYRPKVYAPLLPVAVIKCVEAFMYQACEHDTWTDSPAEKLCWTIKGEAIAHLPGYDAVPWGIGNEEDVRRCLIRSTAQALGKVPA